VRLVLQFLLWMQHRHSALVLSQPIALLLLQMQTPAEAKDPNTSGAVATAVLLLSSSEVAWQGYLVSLCLEDHLKWVSSVHG
jgi:hypothetical protein